MRLVIISDTHSLHSRIKVPDGDVLMHCGDFCGRSTMDHVKYFNDWLGSLPHKHKIVIAGNHDLPFQEEPEEARKTLSAAKYLQDSGVVIDSISFWGSPWQPEFCDWAFNLPRGKALAEKWALIPGNTDVLMTHGPPQGVLDLCPNIYGGPEVNVGCADLAIALARVNPRVHAFGHIHEGYGVYKGMATDFYNASICTGDYHPTNLPHIVDL